MASRITVMYKVADARGETKRKQFESLGLAGKIQSVAVADSYTIDSKLDAKSLEKVAAAFANPHLEKASINTIETPKDFSWLIEVGFLPGVTDNVGATAKETIEDVLKKKFKKGEAVYNSRIFFISGKVAPADIEKIAFSLHNPLIERARILTATDVKQQKGLPIVVPKVTLVAQAKVITVDLNVSDEELAKIGKQGIRDKDGTSRGPLALDLAYMKAIKEYFNKQKRNPTDVELESIAQTWSEHCKHTIFANPLDDIKEGLYKAYIKKATQIIRKKKGKRDFCISVFTDNAGGIEFDKDYVVTHKVETHNSPSALDPFGGSITGIVGVNRDAMGFGLGAKPIANVYGFCLADPKDTRPLYRDKEQKQKMLSPKRIMDGVIQGVHVGGNCSGIPTVHGFLYFDERFRGKPLVFVGTIGLIPKKIGKRISTEKSALPGDYIVMAGGRVGQDGIHGATFSSEGMDAGSPATAVQIGDPITQKKMSDAIVKEARDLDLYTSITDNGAGGISCSVAEMAKECGGCKVELEKVPLKYPGMAPWKTWISESQERMTLSVPKKKWQAFKKLMERRGVEATVIGEFTDSGKCVVTYNKKTVMDIELEFLHNGLPEKQLVSNETCPIYAEPKVQNSKNVTPALRAMLERLNLTSYEFISSQYDHEVQSSSVLKPLAGRGRVNTDTAVFRPVLTSTKGVVVSSALYPSYSEINSYNMAAASIDTALRRTIVAGANLEDIALLDNFCWCNSTDPVRLYQLKEAVRACFDYSVAYETPLISGKDSMFNDFKGFDENGNPIMISVPPTLLISTLAVMTDVEKAISIDFKFKGDLVYLLGDTNDELGGSEYFAYLSEKEGTEYRGNSVPAVDAEKNKKLYQAFSRCKDAELVASAISVDRGGLAAAFLKSAMAGRLGATLSLAHASIQTSFDDFALFSESQGRIVVSVNPKNQKKFEALMKGISYALLGKVTADSKITITGQKGNQIAQLDVDDALTSYKKTFKNN